MDSLKPKKHLGQHFLAHENTALKIVELLNAPREATIVEIGPGMGVLTKYLVEAYDNVMVVEYDLDAVEYLKAEFAETNLQVHHADFLKWSLPENLTGPTYFIGNLPYNISSQIFFRLLENTDYVQQGVFMVQKEVADRVCAKEDAPAKLKGILSILVNRYFKTKKALKVRPSVFRPPPKVMSAVFTMDRRQEEGEPAFSDLKRVVKAAFGKRRKTLRNSLKELQIDWEQFPEKWPTLRAEALPFDAFDQLAESLNSEDHVS